MMSKKPMVESEPVRLPPASPPSSGIEDHLEEEGELGAIQIHNSVIAIIARLAASEVQGVSEMSQNLVENLAGLVQGRRSGERGVHVEIVDNQVVLNMHVTLDYGVSIPKVAWQVQHQVREAVERQTGKQVRAVNVFVQNVAVPADRRKDAEV